MTPGPFQLLLVVLLILIVFGASRVPAIAENLAKGIKSFKKGLKDDDTPAVTDESKKD
ncbi:MAG: twin-arginine translocase TatA/TatE family subunit, partial [Pseudomonadota bacterium]